MERSVYHQLPHHLNEEWVIIQRAQANPAAFAPLYKKYYQQIYRYILNRAQDADHAEDVTSQVFLKALNHIGNYQFKGVPFASWLYRIAKSEVYQSHRDTKTCSAENLILTSEPIEIYEFDDDLFEQRKYRLLNAIKALKSHEIELVELRFFERLSFAEIGTIKGTTENNAKVKTFRVLQKLKRALAE
jgi:RNA polymerase sigma-70 factor (ECF subfamily)